MLPSFYSWTKRGLGAALFLTRVDRYAKNLCRANKSVVLSLCLKKAESSQFPVKSYEASVIASSFPFIHKRVPSPLFFCLCCEKLLTTSISLQRYPVISKLDLCLENTQVSYESCLENSQHGTEPASRCLSTRLCTRLGSSQGSNIGILSLYGSR